MLSHYITKDGGGEREREGGEGRGGEGRGGEGRGGEGRSHSTGHMGVAVVTEMMKVYALNKLWSCAKHQGGFGRIWEGLGGFGRGGEGVQVSSFTS